ncbi:MAG TPA: deoxyhypusine synthase family protein [Candidatus Thermoplasmatota archaeon]|nr:deoxyhypusine synthase family protein [Candidatus Thermoplasmatota archaeon]
MPAKTSKADFFKTPIQPFEATKVGNVADLIDAMKNISFQGRNLGTAMQVWENMLQDPDRPTIILGVAGSLMAGGMRKVIRDLIRYHLVDVVVSVGSQPYQDMYAARGYGFYRASPDMDDLELREHMIDRLYDTLVDEDKFRETDDYLGELAAKLDPQRTYTTRELMKFYGEHFRHVDDSWVAEAARQNVPVFVPTIHDSSIGIGMVYNYTKAKAAGKPYPKLDMIRDAYEVAQIKYKSQKTGIIYLGGGVPKNYIQQTEVIAEVLGHDAGGHQYAIQLTQDSPDWGALSGCTFKEAQSWGKIAKDADFVQAKVDITIGLPILAAALVQKKSLWERRKKLEFVYDGDELSEIRQV